MGVICHFGESSMSGHFIAFCKHFTLKGDKWYKAMSKTVKIKIK